MISCTFSLTSAWISQSRWREGTDTPTSITFELSSAISEYWTRSARFWTERDGRSKGKKLRHGTGCSRFYGASSRQALDRPSKERAGCGNTTDKAGERADFPE